MQNLTQNNKIDISDDYLESAFKTMERLTNFKSVTDWDILSVLFTAPPNSCELGPTTLLKVYSDVIVLCIMDIVNTSIISGSFTKNIKQTLLRPLLRRKALDLVLCNYILVSSLPYISKLIKRVVCDQLTSYKANSDKTKPLQSAYKPGHSTEMAMLKVKTNSLDAINQNKVVCLVILDLRVTFDTVNHDYLLNHLKFRFGVDGTVLAWLTDYLTDWTQRVVLNGEQCQVQSDSVTLKCSVSQGSVLGPILFTLCISPLGDFCRKHGIEYHSYADEQQEYLSFALAIEGGKEICLTKLQICIQDIRLWMKTNLLMLNDSQMEFIMVGSKQNLIKADADNTAM